MRRNWYCLVCLVVLVLLGGAQTAMAQRLTGEDSEFGPIVRAYLAYLRNEQEVVDDRASRHEIKRAYYLRNSNRIRALRQTAIRIARESENDYLPELEAAANDELGNIFEHPPNAADLVVGEVYNNTFRFLGTVRAGDVFYIFARLDPYEQADLMQRESSKPAASDLNEPSTVSGGATNRPRRAGTP